MLQERLLDGRLKLRHLTLIAAIAEHGSLVATARALHITQPVVTRGLHEVEEILGVSLFERGPRGVTPTIFGDSFVTHARSIIAQLRQAGGQIDLLTRAEIGRVRVGTHLAGANVALPRAITSLKREHPRLTVEVQEATPDLLYDALLSGETDLIIGRLRADTPEHLHQERLYLEPIHLVARADHPAHQLRAPRLAQLTDYPWIFPVAQTALRSELEASFVAEGLAIPTNRIECTSILIVRELLHSTDVIAALPHLIVADDDRIGAIKTNLPAINRSVGVTYPADMPLVPAAQTLLTHLRKASADLEH
ncbi:MAG: LysR family transcriptional regulator [Actinophytocola sp.]|nr:LysR family transcriptional regulator [Actinophytocola sp.]